MKKLLVALCAISVVAPAFAASSLRRLGGTGTYAGTASAVESKKMANTVASSVNRAGTLRVAPTITKSAKVSTAAKTTGGTALKASAKSTANRLSVGKYLGGTSSLGMVSGGGSSTEGAGDVDLTGYATEEYVDTEVSQLQKQIDTKVDTTADSVNEMAGEYNITGVMYVETPELPEVSVNEPN